MTKSAAQIHVAYAIGRRGGTHYRARAYAADVIGGRVVKHTFTIAIDDSADAATAQAVEYIRDQYRRADMTPPETVTQHGRKPGAVVDGFLF